jgi:hypothetical protein
MADEKSEVEEWIGRIAAALFIGVIVFLVAKYGFNAVWYGTKNGVGADRTYVEAKPIDCDYDYAPLGNKGCHYEARETTYGEGSNKSVSVQWVKVKD